MRSTPGASYVSCHNSPLTFRWERSTQYSFILLLRYITLVHTQGPRRRRPFVYLPTHVMLNELGKKILKVRCTVYSALDKYADEVPNSDFDWSDTISALIHSSSGIRGEYSPRPQQQPPAQYPPPIGGRGRGGGGVRGGVRGARPPLDRCDTKRISLRGRRGQVMNACNACL